MPRRETSPMDQRMQVETEYHSGLFTMTELDRAIRDHAKDGLQWVARYDADGVVGLPRQPPSDARARRFPWSDGRSVPSRQAADRRRAGSAATLSEVRFESVYRVAMAFGISVAKGGQWTFSTHEASSCFADAVLMKAAIRFQVHGPSIDGPCEAPLI